MTAVFVCDGCGVQEKPSHDGYGRPIKPDKWFSRTPEGRNQIDACSRACVERVNATDTDPKPIIPI